MATIEELAAVLRSIVTPGIKPKALSAAIRDQHPSASKKEIVRAAFYALTETSTGGPEATAELHNFALAERLSVEDADASVPVG